MFTIGEFASIGRVTVRTLHHYDRIGLLKPAAVDPWSGYRRYAPEQVALLTRILELRDFGLRLDEIARLIQADAPTAGGGQQAAEDEQQLLRAARQRLAHTVQQDTARLQRLDAYLRRIEGENVPTTITADVTTVPATRVAYATATAGGFGPEHMSPVIGPLFERLAGTLASAGIRSFGPAIATYDAVDNGSSDSVLVTAAYVIDDTVDAGVGYGVTVLPAIDRAAVTTHHGSVATIGDAWQALMSWVGEQGWTPSGPCREIYHSPADVPQEEWVTDLQQPVTRS